MSDAAREVGPVRAGEELRTDRLEEWLRAQIDGLPEAVMQVEQFPRGRANLTYRLSFGRRRLVLRRPPFGTRAPGAHDMGREHMILSRLWQVYPRAPRAYALCLDEAVIGAPFVVQDYRADGTVIFGEAPDDMAGLSDLGERLCRAMAEALADLHAIDPQAAGLGDLGRSEGFVARQLAGWRDRWERVAAPDCAPAMEAVAQRLARDMPPDGPGALIHNDYKLDNCQFARGKPDTVVSLFDWDMATIGDPLVDVGITLAYWSHMRRHATLGLPHKQRFAMLYAERTAIELERLRWYEGFANWRTAVAVQQLYDRYVKGDSRDDRLAAAGRTIPLLAARAQAILDGKDEDA